MGSQWYAWETFYSVFDVVIGVMASPTLEFLKIYLFLTKNGGSAQYLVHFQGKCS
jgi:hypothetical protein